MSALSIPVLDIGGTHVTSAMVRGGVVVEQHRADLDSQAPGPRLIGQIGLIASRLHGPGPDATWGIAIPGPFDYAAGVGDFEGVDKFQDLRGVAMGPVLRRALPGPPGSLRFINDAEAYALGEWAAHGRPRMLICITLGTGVGSGFLADGEPVTTGSDVPSGGNVHTQTWDGLPLEDTVSRRAIRRQYRDRCGIVDDVAGITQRYRDGDPIAGEVLNSAMEVLGTVLGPWVDRFGAEVVVIGGSMAASWDVLGPPLLSALRDHSSFQPACAPGLLGDDAPMVGAALFAGRAFSPPPDRSGNVAGEENGE